MKNKLSNANLFQLIMYSLKNDIFILILFYTIIQLIQSEGNKQSLSKRFILCETHTKLRTNKLLFSTRGISHAAIQVDLLICSCRYRSVHHVTCLRARDSLTTFCTGKGQRPFAASLQTPL
jgi:hypothetical protein